MATVQEQRRLRGDEERRVKEGGEEGRRERGEGRGGGTNLVDPVGDEGGEAGLLDLVGTDEDGALLLAPLKPTLAAALVLPIVDACHRRD